MLDTNTSFTAQCFLKFIHLIFNNLYVFDIKFTHAQVIFYWVCLQGFSHISGIENHDNKERGGITDQLALLLGACQLLQCCKSFNLFMQLIFWLSTIIFSIKLVIFYFVLSHICHLGCLYLNPTELHTIIKYLYLQFL